MMKILGIIGLFLLFVMVSPLNAIFFLFLEYYFDKRDERVHNPSKGVKLYLVKKRTTGSQR